MDEVMQILAMAREVITAGPEQAVEKLLKKLLKGTPFANKAYAVGGYVRDEMLGIDAKDLDIVVEIRGGAKKLTSYIHNQFPGQVTRPHKMGAAYPIWQITFKDNVELDGKEYRTKGAVIEFADTQKETFPDEDSRQRITEYGTLKEDAERRDFTVNMLMRDLTNSEVKDLTGRSVADINEGILRHAPGIDIAVPFRQDPLRMMRLIRFQAKYGWKVPMHVLKAIKANAGRIQIISAERIRDELIKIMKVGKLGKAIRIMKITGLLEYVMPEIDAMRGVEHEYSKGSHQEGDVYKHTLMVLKSAKPGVYNQLSALLHDVGKPKTQETIEGLIRFLGHEKVSGEIAEAIMRRLKFELKDVKAVRRMVENHMRPHHLTRSEAGTKALRKFIRSVGEELVDSVLDLAEADALGNIPTENNIPKLRKMIDEARKIPVKIKMPLNGHEIQNLLGLEQGPEVGEAIQFLQDKMDEAAAQGREISKSEAEKILLDGFGG